MTSIPLTPAVHAPGPSARLPDCLPRLRCGWARLGALGAGLLQCAAFAQPGLPNPPQVNPPASLLGELVVEVTGDRFAGTGYGQVSTPPSGVPPGLEIECGGAGPRNCSTHYPPGARVQLIAVARASAEFIGWGGACAYAQYATSCSVTIAAGQVHRVTADFRAPRVDVQLLGPVGQRVRLSWPSQVANPSWQQSCVRSADSNRCDLPLPPGADKFDVRPQPVDGRWPAVSCAAAAQCATAAGELVVVDMRPTAANRHAVVTVDTGLGGALLVQKVRGSDCSLPETRTELRVLDAGGQPLQVVHAQAAASLVPVPTPPSQLTVRVGSGPGRVARWLGCQGSLGLQAAAPQAAECVVAITGLQTLVTACFP